MKFNSITKLIFIIVATFIFASCVSNDDKPKPIIPKVPVELNVENLKGTWEVYYFTKKVIPVATKIESIYRYTENDGFKVTYNADGTYIENNAFGDETIEDGKYLLGNYKTDDTTQIWKNGASANPDLKKDGIFMSYTQTTLDGKKVARTTKAEVPNIFATDFVFRYRDGGTVNGHAFQIEDMRYFRHAERGKDYLPSDPAFKKNVLDEKDLLGRWEHYDSYLRIDHQMFHNPPFLDSTDVYLFRIVDGKREFYEFKGRNATVANRSGEYKIIDDVVNIFTFHNKTDSTGNVKKVVESFKLWMKDPMTTNGQQKMIKSYDKYRDIKDALQEKEEFDYYRRIANQ